MHVWRGHGIVFSEQCNLLRELQLLVLISQWGFHSTGICLQSKLKESRFGLGQIKERSNSVCLCPQGKVNQQTVVIKYVYYLKLQSIEIKFSVIISPEVLHFCPASPPWWSLKPVQTSALCLPQRFFPKWSISS